MATQTLITKGDESKNRFDIESGGPVPAVQAHCEAHWERAKKFRPAVMSGLCADCIAGLAIFKHELVGAHYNPREAKRFLAPNPPTKEARQRPKLVPRHKPDAIIQAVAVLHKVTPEDIRFHSNAAYYSYPRGTAAYVIRQCLGLSFPAMARVMGRFHHSTMVHAVQNVERRMEQDREYAAAVRLLVKQFSEKKEIVA